MEEDWNSLLAWTEVRCITGPLGSATLEIGAVVHNIPPLSRNDCGLTLSAYGSGLLIVSGLDTHVLYNKHIENMPPVHIPSRWSGDQSGFSLLVRLQNGCAVDMLAMHNRRRIVCRAIVHLAIESLFRCCMTEAFDYGTLHTFKV